MKVGRNNLCPCGSGNKFKKCCMKNEGKEAVSIKDLYLKNYNVTIKDNAQIEGIRKAGKLVMETHRVVEKEIKPGITTDFINDIVHSYTIKNGAICAPLNYRDFPKSVCTSVNSVICHGIPGPYVLQDGDILNVDITSIVDGFYADANYTYFVGNPGEDAKKIVSIARESLRLGLDEVKTGNRVGDIGYAIQSYAESMGCSVVREFIGHGVGIDFHEQPNIPHYGRKNTGIRLIPGMIFTVEPMINLGRKELHVLDDNWTAMTDDESLSAQFEQTVLVTNDGFESLTPFDL
jgi:methionyl aminopeptidase